MVLIIFDKGTPGRFDSDDDDAGKPSLPFELVQRRSPKTALGL